MSVTRIKEAAQQADDMITELARQKQEGAPEQTSANDEAEGGDSAAGDDQGTTEEEVGVQQGGGSQEGVDTAGSSEFDELKQELETERQRYRSLQGMIRKRDEQINQLHELLSGMQQAKETTPQGEQAQAQALLTNEDSQNFGEDMVDMARRAARQEMQAVQQQLDEIRQQIKGVSQTTEQFTEQSFEQQLDSLTESKWRHLDSDPLFIEWLGASRYRQAIFQQAVNQRDAPTVADTFNEYVREQTRQTEEQDAPKRERREQLRKQVAPGKSRSTSTSNQGEGEQKKWTRSEIASVYANSKQYSKEEFDRLDREIAAAQKEGRVDFSR